MILNPKDSAGIITLVCWTLMPNGGKYSYIWSPEWNVITDKDFPVEGFRSTEKWQLIGKKNGEVFCVIPGCQVKAWVKSKTPPPGTDAYVPEIRKIKR